MIAQAHAYKIGQSVRDDGPQTHLTKAGTPTMGGALILVSIAITTLLWGDLDNRFVWVVLLVTLGFGAIGWVDDYRKVVLPQSEGPVGAREVLLAVGDRPRRRGLPRVLGLGAGQRAVRRSCSSRGCRAASTSTAAAGRPHRAVLQDGRVSARRVRLHRADVSSSSSAPATR